MADYYTDSKQILLSTRLYTDGHKFDVPVHVRSCGEKFFHYSAIQDWNVLLVSTTAQTS